MFCFSRNWYATRLPKRKEEERTHSQPHITPRTSDFSPCFFPFPSLGALSPFAFHWLAQEAGQDGWERAGMARRNWEYEGLSTLHLLVPFLSLGTRAKGKWTPSVLRGTVLCTRKSLETGYSCAQRCTPEVLLQTTQQGGGAGRGRERQNHQWKKEATAHWCGYQAGAPLHVSMTTLGMLI